MEVPSFHLILVGTDENKYCMSRLAACFCYLSHTLLTRKVNSCIGYYIAVQKKERTIIIFLSFFFCSAQGSVTL